MIALTPAFAARFFFVIAVLSIIVHVLAGAFDGLAAELSTLTTDV